jgi:hypothetical protein
MKFEVGQRVKVVEDTMDGVLVGKLGTVRQVRDHEGLSIRVEIDDEDELPFCPDELELIDAPKNITTIEGDVRAVHDFADTCAYVGNLDVIGLLEAHNGKRVKLTVEVID